jgi:hypothetical protein
MPLDRLGAIRRASSINFTLPSVALAAGHEQAEAPAEARRMAPEVGFGRRIPLVGSHLTEYVSATQAKSVTTRASLNELGC